MATPLSNDQIAELKSRLEQELERLRGDGPAILEDQGGDGRGDLQDRAADEALRRTHLRIAAHHRRRVVEVEAALRRIEVGTYGVCEETGEAIPYARLAMEPTTRFTVEALEQLEVEVEREAVRAQGNDDESDPY